MYRQIFSALGLRIQSGPFKGMKYGSETCGSALPPKLIGVYEKELFPAFAAWVAAKPRTIVDVGAAEGYYAVGLARTVPGARITAFESTEEGRRMLDELARLNNVRPRLSIKGHGGAEDLIALADADPCLRLLMDIEGGEYSIFTPALAERLRSAHMIIELHGLEKGRHDGFAFIEELFGATHNVQRIPLQPRTLQDIPLFPWRLIAYLAPARGRNAIDEKRTDNFGWAVLTPNGK